MNELEFRCTAAPLPPFCAKCGLVEEHEVHHGREGEFVGERIAAHKFINRPTKETSDEL